MDQSITYTYGGGSLNYFIRNRANRRPIAVQAERKGKHKGRRKDIFCTARSALSSLPDVLSELASEDDELELSLAVARLFMLFHLSLRAVCLPASGLFWPTCLPSWEVACAYFCDLQNFLFMPMSLSPMSLAQDTPYGVLPHRTCTSRLSD